MISSGINAQCDIQTNIRPDNNTIKYFNPKPVIRQSNYEVGVSIYENITSDVLMINVSVLFKKMKPTELNGNLIIQTTNTKGIELKPLVSELIKMNGRDVAIGLYEIDKKYFEEFKNYNVKSIFFYLDSNLIGSTVTENNSVLRSEIECLKKYNYEKR